MQDNDAGVVRSDTAMMLLRRKRKDKVHEEDNNQELRMRAVTARPRQRAGESKGHVIKREKNIPEKSIQYKGF